MIVKYQFLRNSGEFIEGELECDENFILELDRLLATGSYVIGSGDNYRKAHDFFYKKEEEETIHYSEKSRSGTILVTKIPNS